MYKLSLSHEKIEISMEIGDDCIKEVIKETTFLKGMFRQINKLENKPEKCKKCGSTENIIEYPKSSFDFLCFNCIKKK